MNNITYVGEHPLMFDVRWHTHDNWELVLCTSGEGEFRFHDGTCIPYHEGQTVAVPPGLQHTNHSRDGFTNIHLQVSEPSFPNKIPFIVDDDAEGHMRIAFSEARYYYHSDIRRQELVMGALGELIVSYMIVYYDNRELSQPVEKLRSVILSHFSETGFKLDDEMHSMPFNYDYLRKLFQKEMGMTPLKYVLELRMKKAKAALTADWNSTYSMEELAENCGFSDALYFSRVFKKYFGCSPTNFIRQIEKEKETSGF